MASNKKELDELGLGSDSEEDEQEEEQAVPPPPADETSPSAAAATEAKGGLEAAIEASIPEPPLPARSMMSARIDTLGLGSSSEEEEEEEEEDGDGGERNVLPSSATDLGRQTRSEARIAAAEPVVVTVPLVPRLPPKTQAIHVSLNPLFVGVQFKESSDKGLAVEWAQGPKGRRGSNCIRWRFQRDENGKVKTDPFTGRPLMESNARLVCWPDGSRQLLLGRQRLECQATAIGERRLLVDQGLREGGTEGGPKRYLEPVAMIQEKMILQRGSVGGKGGGRAGRRRSGLAGREIEKKATIKKFESVMDPEREKEMKRRQRDEEDRLERKQKRKAAAFGGRLTKGFLEDEEEIDPSSNVKRIKADVMAGGRRGGGRKGGRRGGRGGDDDEDDDDEEESSDEDGRGMQAQRKSLRKRRQALVRGRDEGESEEEDEEEVEDEKEEDDDDDDDEDEDEEQQVVRRRRGGGGGEGEGVGEEEEEGESKKPGVELLQEESSDEDDDDDSDDGDDSD
ncbi:Hypothetical protein NocV09_00800200 [Nannochloropsis oceanica]